MTYIPTQFAQNATLVVMDEMRELLEKIEFHLRSLTDIELEKEDTDNDNN